MTETKNRAEAIRTQFDLSQPDWQQRVRSDLDLLTPGWESFPLLVWNADSSEWVEIVLLANPESITPTKAGFWSRVRRCFGHG